MVGWVGVKCNILDLILLVILLLSDCAIFVEDLRGGLHAPSKPSGSLLRNKWAQVMSVLILN